MTIEAVTETIRAITHPGTRVERLAAVEQGLRDHSLYQTGGVIRQSLPPNERGRIFAHVYQTGATHSHRAVDWISERSYPKGVMNGFMMVNTALSVVNLGVSIAGFTILAQKIDRLDKSIKSLEAAVHAGFQGIHSRLDRIEYQLNGIAALVERADIKINTQIDRLRNQIDWTLISRLQASVESLAEIEAGRKSGMDPSIHAERIRECRTYLSGVVSEAINVCSNDEVGVEHLRARTLLFALAQSIVAEAYAWRLADETAVAARVLALQVPAFRDQSITLSVAFLGGDVAILGGSLSRELPFDQPYKQLVSSFLLQKNIAEQDDLSRILASRWAVYLSKDPARSRALLREPHRLNSRIDTSIKLLFPLAEASNVLDGLESEYQFLASHSILREQWEMTQQQGHDSLIYIREFPNRRNDNA